MIKDRDVHSRVVADVAVLAGGGRKLAKLAGMPFQAISELKCRKLSGVSPLNRAKLLRVAKLLWRKAGYSDYADRILELDGCYAGNPKPLKPRKPKGAELQQCLPRPDELADLPAELRASLAGQVRRKAPKLPGNDQSPWYRSGWYKVTLKEARSLAEIGATVLLHGHDWNNLPEDGLVEVAYLAPPPPPDAGTTPIEWQIRPVEWPQDRNAEEASEGDWTTRAALESEGLVGPTVTGADAERVMKEALLRIECETQRQHPSKV